MSRICLALLALAFLLPLEAPRARAEGGRSFEGVEKVVEEALESEDPKVRGRAFAPLADCFEIEAVTFLLDETEDLWRELDRIRDDQQDIEKGFEKQFNKKLKLDQWFENSNRSPRDLKRYNKEAKKIRKQLDRLHQDLRNLEDTFARTRSLLHSATPIMGEIVKGLGPEDIEGALAELDAAWRDGRHPPARFWWLDALAESGRPEAASRLEAAARSAQMTYEFRGAALEGLAALKNPVAFDLALPFLQEKRESAWHMTAASVEVMRLLHEKRCIEPLIEFLGRDDIKRLREDAHAALQSLTAEKHGPYKEPWQSWWEDHRATFQMPTYQRSTDRGARVEDAAPGESVTFYGIRSFSDRILFILDVSGSMDQTPKAGSGGARRPKIDVARQELSGALDLMNDGASFNMIFFNHQVLPWQAKMQEVSSSSRRRAGKWIEEQVPEGGTNIHDALAAGFELALRATGDPLIDTIFFLTDGRPTSGMIQDPETILAEVEQWNRAARLKVHCVGVGDHDQEFMQKLAALTGGEYVRR